MRRRRPILSNHCSNILFFYFFFLFAQKDVAKQIQCEQDNKATRALIVALKHWNIYTTMTNKM